VALAEVLELPHLLLFDETRKPWSAHVGVYPGEGLTVHLPKQIGRPATWGFACLLRHPGNAYIGAKRISLQPLCSFPPGTPEPAKQSQARAAFAFALSS
jgi:hypothetical protein